MQRIAKGEIFGDWELKKPLGQGGNGVVWLAVNSKSEQAAIKILAKLRGKKKVKIYARFRDEVNIIRTNADIQGLLPIIDYFLPEEIKEEMPWYVMPVALPLEGYLNNRTFESAIEAVLEISKTLIKLHTRGISHRDIKPPNLLVKDGQYFLADFGLVDYPDKSDLTSIGEQVGAKWTIAPEMKRNSNQADGRPADVYSLAKTLWILLTGQKYGFEGRYDPNGINGLSNFGLTEPERDNLYFADKPPALFTTPLDDLLRASTNDEPAKRPTIDEFVEKLNLWVEIYKDFRKRNPLQWKDVQTRFFPQHPHKELFGMMLRQ